MKKQQQPVRSRAPPALWESILARAIVEPGLIHDACRRFHRYSLRNQLLAMAQCLDRGLAPGPIATYREWARLGRYVLRGQKALVLCMPITVRTPATADRTDDADDEKRSTDCRTSFVFRSRWFVLSQTEGKPYEPVALSSWSEGRALATLGIERVVFAHPDGNTQGYATSDRQIAINPVAALPHKTLFHELAHVLLHHDKQEDLSASVREVEAEGVALLCCEALGLEGAAYARGYLQLWLKDGAFTSMMAQRIIAAAQRILDAGADAEAKDRGALAG